MTQPSTLPAEAIHKAFIRAYYVGTHSADIQLAASPLDTLPGVRVATHIQPADCVVDRECTVLFFDASNPADPVVIAVQGALPTPPSGGSYIADTDLDTYVRTEETADEDVIRFGTAAVQRATLNATALTLVHRLTLMRSTGVAPGTKCLLIAPQFGEGDPTYGTGISITPDSYTDLSTFRGVVFSPTGCGIKSGGTCIGFYGNTIFNLAAYATSGSIQGLAFTAYAACASSGILTTLTACYIKFGASNYHGTITAARGLHIAAPFGGVQDGTIPTLVGVDIENMGLATAADVYALRIADITAGTNKYLMEIGPATPYLRLLGGAAPAANCTNLYLAEGVTPTLRRAQWKLQSDLVAGDRIMVLV